MNDSVLISQNRIFKQVGMIQEYIVTHIRAKHGNPIETQMALMALGRNFELMNQNYISEILEVGGKKVSRDDFYRECRAFAEDIAQGLYKVGQKKNE